MGDISTIDCRDIGPGRRASGIAGALLVGVSSLLVLYAIYVLIFEAFVTVPIDSAAYHAWLERVSWSTGIAMLILAVSFILLIGTRRAGVSVVLLIATIIGVSTVLWINYLRPGDVLVLFDIDAYENFKLTMLAFEIVVIVLLIVVISMEVRFQHAVSEMCPNI
jgi:hypothetical protein